MSEKFLENKLLLRRADQTYRSLQVFKGDIDLYSNDYLGITTNHCLDSNTSYGSILKYGSTGSRLLAGNSLLAEQLEADLAAFHEAEGALLFNSGYDANLLTLTLGHPRKTGY